MTLKHVLPLLFLVGVLGMVPELCEGKHAVVCRVNDPSVLQGCDVRRDCLFEVYPVEKVQNLFGAFHSTGSNNKLFALYGGPTSCAYFGNLISSCVGRQTLVETVQSQLQKSGFRGVEIQCDPAQYQFDQQDFSEFLTSLRKEIGGGYIISVFIQSVNIEPCLITVLNNVVDLVTVPMEGCASQLSVVQNLIGHGLNRLKILLDVPLPTVVKCPLESGPGNLFSLVQDIVNVIKNQDLLGATLQLDRDDVAGVCAKGQFPLFKHLIVLLKSCAPGFMHSANNPMSGQTPCNFKGYIRDTRDCSSFFSCNNGVPNQLQCPPGLAFDLCSSTCQPVLQVNCNDNSCTLTGAVNGGQCPIPIPYPFPVPGTQNNNGSTDLGPCLNISTIQIINNQTSELLELLDRTKLDNIIGVVNDLTEPLQKSLGNIVGNLEVLLRNLLGLNDSMGGTMGQMDEMNKKMNLLEDLLLSLLKLLKDLLGLDLTGLLGIGGGGAGGGLGAITGAVGGADAAGGAVGAIAGGAPVGADALPVPGVGGVAGLLGK